MANMSYCRFENTLKDLRDCWENFEDPQGELSDTEERARKKLVELCREIAKDAMA